jgi:hypothetical protein
MRENNSLKFIIFMKAGYHTDETLDEIIRRKMLEEKACGVVFWGYNGVLCHPLNQVVPFVKKALRYKVRPKLLLTVTSSKFQRERHIAAEYSVDGTNWLPFPKQALLTGCKYSIVCKNLRPVNFNLDLNKYRVAIGKSAGRTLGDYIKFHTDKACAVLDSTLRDESKLFKIAFEADVVRPYAVFTR